MLPGFHERGASDENRAAEAKRHPPLDPPRVAVSLEGVQLHPHPDGVGHEEHRHPDEPGGGATTADQEWFFTYINITQVCQTENLNRVIRSRQPRWRRSSRLRKSIAVMDQRPTNSRQPALPPPPVRSASANEISPIMTPNPVARTRSSSCCRGGDYGVSANPKGGNNGNMSKAFSSASVDNLLEPAASEEDAQFLRKVCQAKCNFRTFN